MNKILFIGNVESPYIKEVLEQLLSTGKQIIMSANSYHILDNLIRKINLTSNCIETWSWNDVEADYYVQDSLMDIFPYLYPDTINPIIMNNLLDISHYPKRSYGSFRLGFGVQEELFDLYLAQYVGATEIAYFDIISSLQLLNPINQFEYRKRSYEFLRFVNKAKYNVNEKNLIIKRYKIIRSIPFYEGFSKKFGYPPFISHYIFEE